ncbi:hypothetical protein FT637_23230 [Bacillus cereus]|nr:hypothetical protein [Bacillus cereus]MBE7122106.1 hypothetical protein [Bacillus cereus]
MNSCLQTKNTSIEFAYLVCEFNGGVFFMYHYSGSLHFQEKFGAFFVLVAFILLKLMDVWCYPISINLRNFNTPKYKKTLFFLNKLD